MLIALSRLSGEALAGLLPGDNGYQYNRPTNSLSTIDAGFSARRYSDNFNFDNRPSGLYGSPVFNGNGFARQNTLSNGQQEFNRAVYTRPYQDNNVNQANQVNFINRDNYAYNQGYYTGDNGRVSYII